MLCLPDAGRHNLFMSTMKSAAHWMTDRGLSLAQLIAASKLEPRIVEAIVQGRYTPSPEQRERLAAALGISTAEISWDHANPVEHMYGHGPQFGRSP
jgi:ribosome-binding protein aMBF1 (putative translation factor)